MKKQTEKTEREDFTLSDGTKITFDLRKMTYSEFKGLFDPSVPQAESQQVFASVAGVPVARVGALEFTEYQRLFAAFLKKTREPLPDDA